MKFRVRAFFTGKCFVFLQGKTLPLVVLSILANLFLAVCSFSEPVDFETVLMKAVDYSHDIKMSRLDINISQASLTKARSAYYPAIRAQWNTEYARDLTGGTYYQSNYIGGNVFVQNTMYQSSMLLGGTYNLFSFGATAKRVGIARNDVDVKRSMHSQTIRDIKRNVLKIYANLNTSYRELDIKGQLLAIYRELSRVKARLHKAGTVSKVEAVDHALKVTKTVDEIETIKLKMAGSLSDLSFYTGDAYTVESFEMNDLDEVSVPEEDRFDINKTPESRMYGLEIEKKNAEIDALKRELYPKIDVYSNYIWYGSDETASGESARSLRPRNFVIGLVATMYLFEGFKSMADIDKAKIESERLKLEKARKLLDLSRAHAKLVEEKKIRTLGIANQTDMLRQVNEKLAMIERMFQQKVVGRTEYLNQKVELLEQSLELRKVIIGRTAALRELDILSQE